ncbi:MAG TPA: hypothetical protein VMX94_07305 [Armatimonadota bacterium]|nr:hypothetical protein [Armatimonadota bacterium]
MKKAKSKLTGCLLAFTLLCATVSGWTQEPNGGSAIVEPGDSALVSKSLLWFSPNEAEPTGDGAPLRSLACRFGRLNFKLDYQGNELTGLTAPAQQKMSPHVALNQLGRPDRFGFDLGCDLGKGSIVGLSRISGDIDRRSLRFAGKRLNFSADVQEIGEGFERLWGSGDAQADREQGIKRTNIQLSLAPLRGMDPKSAWNALIQDQVEDESGKFTSRALNFAGRGFTLSAADNKIDEGFARLSDLTPAEQTKIVLSIYQQFDPNAQAANVAAGDLQHIVNEPGIERRNIRSSFQLGSASAAVQFLTVGDETGGIDRQTLSLQGKNYRLTGMLQSIDESFTRVTTLAPIERSNFGREYGMRRMNLAGDFTLKSGTRLSTSFARVTAGDSGLVKYGLSVAGKKLSLTGNFQDIDPEFDRAMDLADPTRSLMSLEQGMKRYDLSLGYQASKSVSISSYIYDAKHSAQDSFQRQLINNIIINPSRGPRLNLYRYELAYGVPGYSYGYVWQKFTLDHKIGFLSLGALYDSKSIESGAVETTSETLGFNVGTDPTRRTSFAADWKKLERTGGGSADWHTLSLQSKLSPKLDFTGTRSVLKTDVDERTFQDYRLSGKVFGNTTLACRFGESLIDLNYVARIRELSVTPGGQRDYGVFKKVNWTFAFAEMQLNDLPYVLTGSARLESEIMGAKFAYEHLTGLAPINYAAGINVAEKTMSRSFSLASPQDPKKPLHFDLAYKVMDPAPGPQVLVRSYNADWRIGSSTKLEYHYANGGIPTLSQPMPVAGERLRLTTALTNRLGLVGEWRVQDDEYQDMARRTLSLGVAGKVSSLGALEASYGFDRVMTPGGETSARTYRLRYSYRVSPDQFLTFSGRYTDWSGPRPADCITDDLVFQLDFKTLFNW